MTFTLICPGGRRGVVPNSWVGEGSRIGVQTSLAPSIGDFIVARLQPTTFTDIIATATSNVAGSSRLCDLEVAWDDHAGRPSGIPLPGPSAANGLPAGVLVVDLVLTYFNASLAVLDGPTPITGAYFLVSLTQASGQVLRRLFDRMDAIEANLSLLVAGQAQFTSLALHTAHTGVTGAGTITPAAGVIVPAPVTPVCAVWSASEVNCACPATSSDKFASIASIRSNSRRRTCPDACVSETRK